MTSMHATTPKQRIGLDEFRAAPAMQAAIRPQNSGIRSPNFAGN